MLTIYYAIVHHKHGEDLYIAWTSAELNAKIYNYIKDWWTDFVPMSEHPEPPKDMDKAIDMYYEYAGDQEWLNYGTTDIEPLY